jgi:putative transposase
LCQEDLYLLELLRYIHLNPLRTGIVKELVELDKYPYCGHSVLMGKNKREWQDTDYILRFYNSKYLTARRRYREYVEKGLGDGRRPELVGGGLVRSAGGWSVVKVMRRGFERMKGDERILGEGDFVETVLKAAQENLDCKSQLEAQGYSFDWLVGRVARQLEVEPKDVLAPGKYAQSVKARSMLCYWGVRELSMTTVDLARRLNLAQPTVSQAVIRGQKIAEDQGLGLIEKTIQ